MKKMTMKKYVVTVCQEVKYMIICAALLLSFFTTVNAAEKEAPKKQFAWEHLAIHLIM